MSAIGHSHDHGHAADPHSHDAPGRPRDRRRLLAVLTLTVIVMVAEVVGGLWSGSLALLSDAGHMLTDAAALALAVMALWIAARPADQKRTYGFFRLEVLSALINGVSLVVISAFVAWEAIARIAHPEPLNARLMLGVATIGLFANLIGIKLLSHSHNLNVRAAFLHVLGDALSSVGVMIAAVVAWITGWSTLDPIISIVIAVVIALSAVRLIRQAVHVLLEGVPEHVELVEVYSALGGLPGVLAVHDLHIWTISHGIHALSAHLVVAPDAPPADTLLMSARHILRDRFHLDHATLQLESETFARATEAEEASSHQPNPRESHLYASPAHASPL